MYDYEYESDILGALRVLKYIQLHRPKVLEDAREAYPKFRPNNIEDVVWDYAWQLFDNAFFDFYEDYGMEIIVIDDKMLDRYWKRCKERMRTSGYARVDACKELFQNVLSYYFTATSDTVVRVECFFAREGVTVRLWLSSDIFEPVNLANDVVDLLEFVKQECARDAAPEESETEWKEAA